MGEPKLAMFRACSGTALLLGHGAFNHQMWFNNVAHLLQTNQRLADFAWPPGI